jgi:hypothetical protein
MAKQYSFSEIKNIDDLPNDAVIVLDDKPRKFDPTTNRFCRPK